MRKPARWYFTRQEKNNINSILWNAKLALAVIGLDRIEVLSREIIKKRVILFFYLPGLIEVTSITGLLFLFNTEIQILLWISLVSGIL